jgi:6-phosphogluconolactonase
MGYVQLHHFADAQTLARGVAERWLGASGPLARTIALSGGRIARVFLESAAVMVRANAGSAAARAVREAHYFWADERCVPPDDRESNYRLAREAWFEPLGIRGELIHRIKGELKPEEAASEIGDELASIVPPPAGGIPALDLVLLGMGEDGHIASLFPGRMPMHEQDRHFYLVADGPKPPNPRITMTFGLLAAAKAVWVLVAGDGKEGILRNSLAGKAFTPLAHLLNLREATVVFVDRFF